MTSPIDTELLAPTSEGVRLPALGSPELTPAYLARIKEILEILLGRRGGSQWDRAVTFRDLYRAGGVPGFGGGALPAPAMPAGQQQGAADGLALQNSQAYRELLRRIGSVEDLALLPDQFRTQLQQGLADAARTRQADLQTIERKLQSAQLSLASRLNDVTAALDKNAAGVRQFSGAYADSLHALAIELEQVTASLGDLGGVTVEEKFLAQADAIDGLQGQWSVKIQAGSDANPVIAGIALAVEDPVAGAGTSSLVFMAEHFGFVLADGGHAVPFSIDGSSIRFNGNVSINGLLALGAGGLQPGFEAPNTKNTEADFSPYKRWEFANTMDGWATQYDATATLGADSITLNSVGGDPVLSIVGLAINGALWNKIRVKLRRLAGAAWQGQVYYSTAGHGSSEAYTKIIAADPTVGGAWVVVEWDMASLSAGGADWTSNTVTALRLDLGNSAADKFEIDWIAVGKYGPPVDIASLNAAQSSADSANTAIATIGNQNVLSKGYKPQVILAWNSILGEKTGIDTQADALAVSRTDYDNSYTALYTYLTGLVPSYTDTTTDTTINGPTFRSKFTDYYNAKEALRTAMNAKAATRAQLGGITGANGEQIPSGAVLGSVLTAMGKDRLGETYSGRADYAADAGATGGSAYRFWSGWTGLIHLNNATKSAIQLPGLVLGKNYRVIVRAKKVGAPTEAIFGAYNGTAATYPFYLDILSRLTTAYQVLDLATFAPSWADGDDVYIVMGSSAMSPTNSAANCVMIDWIAFQSVNADDGATAGATWGVNIGGSNLPADNASSDLVLVGRGVTIRGNTLTKTASTGGWDADASSLEGYVGGAYASAIVPANNKNIMFGLNTDPATDTGYLGIDYGIQAGGNGRVYAHISGVSVDVDLVAYSANSALAIGYDGSYVRWLKNGVILYSVAATITAPLYFDSSFVEPGGTLTNVRFSPLSPNNWASIGGRPSDDVIRNNMVDVSWWRRGASIPWPTNGEYNSMASVGTSGAVDLIMPGPRGNAADVWFCQETTGDGNAGGGWDAPYFVLDTTKTYRFVVPIYRIDGTATAYWGTQNVCNLNTTTVNTNPYFAYTSTLQTGRWYLFVGFIYPAGSTGHTHDNAGVWDCTTGQKMNIGTNWCFNAASPSVNHRAYQYYASANAKQTFGRPFINVVDGTEPALSDYFTYALSTYNAVNDAATGLAAKLQADSHATLTGQLGLQSQYALLVGDLINGVWIGHDGIFLVQGGVTKVSIPISGNPGFAGQLVAAFGTFGALSVAAGGSISMLATAYGQPGIWFGDVGGGVYKFSIVSVGGAKLLFDPTASPPLQLVNAKVSNPTLDTFTATLSGAAGGSFPNGSAGYGTLTVNAPAGSTCHWILTLVSKTGSAGNMVMSAPTGTSVSFSGSGTNATLDYQVTVVVTDASNSRTVTLNTEIVANHGTPP